MPSRPTLQAPSIWWWAFGYFACYAPYTALTKVVTKGIVDTSGRPPTGLELLPVTVMAAVVAAATFLLATGWWRDAPTAQIGGLRVPRPTLPTLLSGLCASGIIATTTLAYTFQGVSIIFVMLIMRGGVLMIAPIVDLVTGRHVRWFSWLGLGLSLAALAVAVGFAKGGSVVIPVACAIDCGLYLACYFIRLNLMTRLAKSVVGATNRRYFVEEQLVSAPSLLIGLAIAAVLGHDDLRAGFALALDPTMLAYGVAIGVLSQGTGIFGGLILLDRSENTFSVPVNRASSILAGVVASVGIWLIFDRDQPAVADLYGAALIVAAIVALTVPPSMERRRRARSQVGATVAA